VPYKLLEYLHIQKWKKKNKFHNKATKQNISAQTVEMFVEYVIEICIKVIENTLPLVKCTKSSNTAPEAVPKRFLCIY